VYLHTLPPPCATRFPYTTLFRSLTRLGFEGVRISINNRKLLDGIGQYAGVPESLQAGLYRSIDKLDKIGLDGVRRELMMVGVPRSEEHTSELQSRENLVCRLLLE